MNHVKNGRGIIKFACKVTAFVMALTLIFALPISAQVHESSGTVRVYPRDNTDELWIEFQNVTHHRIIESQQAMSEWHDLHDMGWAFFDVGYTTGDILLVIYAPAPASVLTNWGDWFYFGAEFVYQTDMNADNAYIRWIFNEPGTHSFAAALSGFWNGNVLPVIVVGDTQPTAEPPTIITDPTPDPIISTLAPHVNTASSWAHNSINNAFSHGLIPQNLQSQYTQATTRAEFTAFAVALYETVTGRTITARASFNDTTDINVQKMGGLGVVSGVGNGNFAPNATITRQEAAAMLARLAYAIGQPLPQSAPTFADNANIATWAVDRVGQVQASGIMSGVGNNNFDPLGIYTREQSIATIFRLFELLS